jgi:predicted dienelactone hydrolase
VRIGAVVIAATGLGMTVEDGGLLALKAPVQLWRAAEDNIAAGQGSKAIFRRELPMPDEHVMPLAGHFAFLAPCSEECTAAAPMIVGLVLPLRVTSQTT